MPITNMRAETRQPVLKTAKVRFGRAVIDGLVVNHSKNGIRISNETATAYPEDVVIELRSGALWTAKLRWQRGLETGFEFIRFGGLGPEAAATARTMRQQLVNSNVHVVLHDLAALNAFDHAGIKAAAATAAAAFAALEHELQAVASTSAEPF